VTAAQVLAALVAVQHFGFLVLEMFLWDKPTGMNVFHTTAEFAAASATMAKNQGLYNGFLAAGLVWGLLSDDLAERRARLGFFLGCVVVAGVFGGVTVEAKIALVQGGPALLALALLFASKPKTA
jgi:putative membrane protein